MRCTRNAFNNVSYVCCRVRLWAHGILGWTTQSRQGKTVTCVYCRAKWIAPAGAGVVPAQAEGAQLSEGYLNLSAVAGVSPVRDTSSCTCHCLKHLYIHRMLML